MRGKWILDNLVGSPPPPPPPEVPALPDSPNAKPLTMRARMEQHRANPACAACHKVMDPMGLALENFDAVGAWRMDDGGQPVDASGQLTDGTQIDGVIGLRQALLQRPEVLVTTATERLLTYALGRGLEPADMAAVRAIVRDAKGKDYRFGRKPDEVVFDCQTRAVTPDVFARHRSDAGLAVARRDVSRAYSDGQDSWGRTTSCRFRLCSERHHHGSVHTCGSG
jgi:hypothetical protein